MLVGADSLRSNMEQIEDAGKIILKVLCGSRAYGLEDSESDFDYHGVYVVPTSKLLSLGPRIRETAWIEGEDMDNTGWELKHFLQMAVNCNPTVLETFVAPIDYSTEEGITLRTMFPFCLARKRIYDAFRGYASNQRKKMFEPTGGKLGGQRMAKAAIAYIRSLYHGTELLMRGTYNPRITNTELREFLLSLKSNPNDIPYGAVIDCAMDWEQQIRWAFEQSTIPHEPNMEAINEFLLETRKRNWD